MLLLFFTHSLSCRLAVKSLRALLTFYLIWVYLSIYFYSLGARLGLNLYLFFVPGILLQTGFILAVYATFILLYIILLF